ncbi:beta-N-acetylglucosaminidase/beta-glucosidase [Cellulomonas fimi]|uniref:Beta-N-acetylglucosaminidase/beta-glucosidase n=2 Tax=Cellulomonas fimi TaxID=1708 RepID=NAG3_CELFI|nr:beta-N-acetylglucosaminidase/beta-glucosidase [Cellulomonas fimi]Q7WUL3.1 RecName: Full=Beta-N-acetylglucosaminidase/beta-glucosidase; AltName: Full=3-beta-N-acetyl-D-glucosaminidase/beta-D-glucosidase; AltName: Full=Nag3 [Cellulomonas fimi]AAQ05801.1 N-acetyl-beta-glucosaminidase [Cellulomonas fimi]AEE47102.1 glycoside hydrolase family 3 domain protein [Cellulomonas fimi ATCC 484]NNH07327.1 beta-N-acetylglucosaminidase/beta-glucosidase [Cellulomonas fimi]VEH35252.1 Beta-N-acetylglucosamini
MIDLTAAPFSLDDDGIAWVRTTLAEMGEDEKLGQLFCLITYTSDPEYLGYLTRGLHVGGVMLRTMTAADAAATVTTLQSTATVPLLISANLEGGASQTVQEATHVGSNMALAATGSTDHVRRAATVIGREARALGINWAFTPVVDIDLNFRNPITNTRTFGADAATVAAMGAEYVEAIQAQGLAASAKHFPGDGVDERDQHLLASVNTMSVEEWDDSFGVVYRAAIAAGVKTVMVGHIMLPAYSRALRPGVADRDILPGVVAEELLNDLLRDRLGFNGLVVSDSTTMAGLASVLPRSQAVPRVIAAGCDMFLFTKNLDEDFGYMRAGIRDGVITPERLDEAVTRILALKASLGLHRGTNLPAQGAAGVLADPDHSATAREVAASSITLVKEEPGVLPITRERYPRVLVYDLQNGGSPIGQGARAGAVEQFVDALVEAGHDVTRFEPGGGWEGMAAPTTDVTERHDLVLYLANLSTRSNQTVVRIEWAEPMGANVPAYVHSVPTVFVSFENPYHLFDVPRVRTLINTYGSSPVVLETLLAALQGKAPFAGSSPVDAFCGQWDTHL